MNRWESKKIYFTWSNLITRSNLSSIKQIILQSNELDKSILISPTACEAQSFRNVISIKQNMTTCIKFLVKSYPIACVALQSGDTISIEWTPSLINQTRTYPNYLSWTPNFNTLIIKCLQAQRLPIDLPYEHSLFYCTSIFIFFFFPFCIFLKRGVIRTAKEKKKKKKKKRRKRKTAKTKSLKRWRGRGRIFGSLVHDLLDSGFKSPCVYQDMHIYMIDSNKVLGLLLLVTHQRVNLKRLMIYIHNCEYWALGDKVWILSRKLPFWGRASSMWRWTRTWGILSI